MGTTLTARRSLAGYAVVVIPLFAAYYALPAWRAQTVLLIELAAAAAVLAGLARNRPARTLPWLLLAAAVLAAAAEPLARYLVTGTAAATVPFPSLADGAYLLEYPLIGAALVLFFPGRASGWSRRSAADMLIFTISIGLLSWFFLVRPEFTSPALGWGYKLVTAAYSLGDLLVLAALARLLVLGTGGSRVVQFLAAGTAAGLAADVAYDAARTYGAYRGGTAADIGWLVCFAAWGAAALQPGMRKLTERGPAHEPGWSPHRLAVLMVASMIAPGFQFVLSLYSGDGGDGELAVACLALFLLVLSRLWDVATSHRLGLGRERTLRLTAAALAVAGNLDEVAAEIRAAAAALMPTAESGVVLAVRDGSLLRPVVPGQPAQPGDPVDLWLGLISGSEPRFTPVADIRAARRLAARSGTVPGMPRTLPGLDEFEGAMLCPLALRERPSGDPFIGLLAVYGQRRVLAGLAAALEILAAQAALAVERVTLTQEVVRQRGEALFRTLVQDTSDVILIVTDEGTVRYATPSAASIFGDVAIEGRPVVELVGPDHREDLRRVLDLISACSGPGPGPGPGYLLRIERLDGRGLVLEVRVSDLRDDRTVSGLVLTLRDVTEQHQLEEELKYQAFHDSLTGLPNRVLFARRAAEALDHVTRTGQVAGVLFVDLDDFKVVNDTMGHGTGDALLIAVAERLAGSVRPSDTAARLGGDEFALLIDGAVDAIAVEAFAERIVAAFAEPFPLAEASVLTSVSVGVATSMDSRDSDELLRHADLALYAAKAGGKRRWRRYQSALSAGMLRRHEVQTALEEAVQNSALILAYQPIVSLASGQIAGFEALVRWPHPRWGIIMPGQFIELAEETGQIVPLGAWVLGKALSDAVTWRGRFQPSVVPEPPPPPELQAGGNGASGPAPPAQSRPYVSVNVSARQFRDPGFVDSVRDALLMSGLPPSSLLLELTESAVVGGTERARADLTELKEIGVRLAIDDFGTGYSSLSYLLELPIDVLKIDKTFVTGIAASWRRHALVEGIVRLAATLEVVIVAEGIETETERQLLAGMGCEYGQGYLLSVPVDAAQAERMLRLDRGLVPELPRQRRRPPARNYLTDQ